MKETIDVFLIDDHKMIIDGLSLMLSQVPKYNLVGFATSGQEAIHNAKKCKHIDIFITDINLPDIDGLVLINSLKNIFPSAKYVVLSMHNNKTIIKSAFQKGIMAYVLKNSGEDELFEAIECAVQSKKFVSKDAVSNLIDSLSENIEKSQLSILTDREITVAKLSAKGLSTAEIASVLFISQRTVETHKRNLMHKLGFKSQGELVKFAIESSWID